jgi:hypothetical protein
LCVLIGMEFYPIRMPAPQFATEPRLMLQHGNVSPLKQGERVGVLRMAIEGRMRARHGCTDNKPR